LSTTLLTRMTGISLHMQWPLTSQSHCHIDRSYNVEDRLLRPDLKTKLYFVTCKARPKLARLQKDVKIFH
jgi:hypothetical protein